jgi:hypothetical protein
MEGLKRKHAKEHAKKHGKMRYRKRKESSFLEKKDGIEKYSSYHPYSEKAKEIFNLLGEGFWIRTSKVDKIQGVNVEMNRRSNKPRGCYFSKGSRLFSDSHKSVEDYIIICYVGDENSSFDISKNMKKIEERFTTNVDSHGKKYILWENILKYFDPKYLVMKKMSLHPLFSGYEFESMIPCKIDQIKYKIYKIEKGNEEENFNKIKEFILDFKSSK